MTFRHVSTFFPKTVEGACIKVTIQYRDVPVDGKPHETSLLVDKSSQKQGYILRAIGGVCGQVLNKKTGQSLLFVSLPEEVSCPNNP